MDKFHLTGTAIGACLSLAVAVAPATAQESGTSGQSDQTANQSDRSGRLCCAKSVKAGDP